MSLGISTVKISVLGAYITLPHDYVNWLYIRTNKCSILCSQVY